MDLEFSEIGCGPSKSKRQQKGIFFTGSRLGPSSKLFTYTEKVLAGIAGFRYQSIEGTFTSVFVEYMSQHFSFHKVYDKYFTYRHDVDMGGLKCGLGIVYEF